MLRSYMRDWYFQALVFSVLLLSTAGCAVQRPLNPDTATSLKGRALTRTARHSPIFKPAVKVPTNLFSFVYRRTPFYAAKTSDAGDQVLRANEIDDPAQAISRQLSQDLEQRYGLRRTPRAIVFNEDDASKLSVAYPSADVVIDVWTQDWGLIPLHDDPSRYHLSYVANFRLIDAKSVRPINGKSGLVLAEGTCSRLPEAPSSCASAEQFMADGARRLKDELALATRACLEEFSTRLLGQH
jgi:hypothetical protein